MLTEYLNQENPVRMPRVVLQDDEYTLGFELKTINSTVQEVYIKGIPYTYCMYNGRSILYTTDSDGNPKKLSCFVIVKNKKCKRN